MGPNQIDNAAQPKAWAEENPSHLSYKFNVLSETEIIITVEFSLQAHTSGGNIQIYKRV